MNQSIALPILQMAEASSASNVSSALNAPPATANSHSKENVCDENANTPRPGGSETPLPGFTLPLTDEQEADESIIADEESEKPGGNYTAFHQIGIFKYTNRNECIPKMC